MPSGRVIIIGAGVSGLAAAFTLRQRGVPVLVLEASDHVGGAIRSTRLDGFLCEHGPNTLMVSSPEIESLLRDAGLLDSALDAAPTARRRFVVQDGKLAPLPDSPLSFLSTSVLSWAAKLRLLAEPFVSRGRDEDETLATFVRRRIGGEPLRELVGPFVSGVYAGNPERLVVRHALPKLHRLEREHGSLILGAMRLRRSGPSPRRLVSWPPGLSGLAAGLASHLGNDLRLSTTVESVKRHADGFVVVTRDGEFDASRVIIATDAATAARLVKPLSPDITALETVPHAPMAVVHLGFHRKAVGHALDGFGVLISRARGIRTLGALFSSTLFPARAPEGAVLLTAFLGGMLDRDALSLDDQALVGTVLRDLTPLLGIASPPAFRNVVRWARAIPQYETGHERVLDACREAEAECPGLQLIGNYRGGISLGDCMENGRRIGSQEPP